MEWDKASFSPLVFCTYLCTCTLLGSATACFGGGANSLPDVSDTLMQLRAAQAVFDLRKLMPEVRQQWWCVLRGGGGGYPDS